MEEPRGRAEDLKAAAAEINDGGGGGGGGRGSRLSFSGEQVDAAQVTRMPSRVQSMENPWARQALNPTTYKLDHEKRRGIKKGSRLPSGLKPYSKHNVAVDGVYELKSRTSGYTTGLVQLLLFGGVVGAAAFCLPVMILQSTFLDWTSCSSWIFIPARIAVPFHDRSHDYVAEEIGEISEEEITQKRGINVCQIPNGLTWTFLVIAVVVATCGLFRILLIKHVTTTFNMHTKMIQYEAHQFLNLDVTALILDFSQAACWRATAKVTWTFASTRKVGYAEDSDGTGAAWAVVGDIIPPRRQASRIFRHPPPPSPPDTPLLPPRTRPNSRRRCRTSTTSATRPSARSRSRRVRFASARTAPTAT